MQVDSHSSMLLSCCVPFLSIRGITCNQCWDEVLIWYEMKVHFLTVQATSQLVFCGLWKCRSVGLFTDMCGCFAWSCGVCVRIYVCFCLCEGDIVLEYVKKSNNDVLIGVPHPVLQWVTKLKMLELKYRYAAVTLLVCVWMHCGYAESFLPVTINSFEVLVLKLLSVKSVDVLTVNVSLWEFGMHSWSENTKTYRKIWNSNPSWNLFISHLDHIKVTIRLQ